MSGKIPAWYEQLKISESGLAMWGITYLITAVENLFRPTPLLLDMLFTLEIISNGVQERINIEWGFIYRYIYSWIRNF